MDQLKVFLRQCVKYRFWIVFGISILLPMIGFLVGSGAYSEATTKKETEIKSTSDTVSQYTAANPPIPEWTKIVEEKNEILTKDVATAQRELYQRQEPLMKWPPVVEDRFHEWGRKWPTNVDAGRVQQAIIDYTIAFPDFASRIYQTFKPWNPENGQGIVVAPDHMSLLKPAPFSPNSPPELGKVWAEQERLWVATALLDVVAKVNDGVKAKSWNDAAIKQIVSLDVGSPLSQDQVSMADGEALEPAPELVPEGGATAAAAATPAPGSGPEGGMPIGSTNTAGEVFHIQSATKLPYTVLPIQITVLVQQDRIPDFLVALENSPMSIQVMEPEITKPATPISPPVVGQANNYAGMGGPGMGSGMEVDMGAAMGMGRGMPGAGPRPGGMGAAPMPGGGPRPGGMGMGMGMNPMAGANPNRSGMNKDRRLGNESSAAKEAKKSVDQYYDIVEVTVYGRARFYDPPAPVAAPADSTSAIPATPTPATPTP